MGTLVQCSPLPPPTVPGQQGTHGSSAHHCLHPQSLASEAPTAAVLTTASTHSPWSASHHGSSAHHACDHAADGHHVGAHRAERALHLSHLPFHFIPCHVTTRHPVSSTSFHTQVQTIIRSKGVWGGDGEGVDPRDKLGGKKSTGEVSNQKTSSQQAGCSSARKAESA